MRRVMIALWAGSMVAVPALASEEDLATAKAGYADADRALNEQYQQTRKALAEREFESLRTEQRAWIRYRDARSTAAVRYDVRSTPEGEEKSVAHYWQTMAGLTRARTVMVRAWRDNRSDKPLTGRYADDYGGSLMIVQKGDRLHFAMEVVRGPTYHTGAIRGVARINGALARYSDNAVGKDEETWITFITGSRRLKVIAANSGYYHGARAYFDGDYLRVGDLTPEQTRAVLDGKASPLGIGE